MQNDVSLSDIMSDDELDALLSAFTLATGLDAVYVPDDGAPEAPDARCAVVPVAYGGLRFGAVHIGPDAEVDGGNGGALPRTPLGPLAPDPVADAAHPGTGEALIIPEPACEAGLAGVRGQSPRRSLPPPPSPVLQAAAELMSVTVSSIVQAGMTTLCKQREIEMQRMRISDLIMEKKRAEETILRAMSGTYPLHKEKELMTNVRLGDKAGARRILNEMLGWVFLTYEGNMDVMKARIVELLVMMSRAAVETGAPLAQLMAMNNRHIIDLADVADFEGLCAWVVSALDAFMDVVYSTRNERSARFIGEALKYMREHYGEPLTLGSVAKVAHISPYYLSHLFREELGETFLERLTFIRMDRAKELLQYTDRTIAGIASDIGYEEPGYFSKVFRKATGQTPNQYRTACKG